MIHLTACKGIAKVLLTPIIAIARWYGGKFPESMVKLRYYARFKKEIDLNNPETLNEKILHLSLRTNTQIWSKLTDKYAVADYVRSKGLGEILVKNLGYWTAIKDFDIKELPNEFILKTTHGCGDVLIINEKSKITNDDVRNHFTKYLKRKYGALEGGKHYLRIQPALVAEELIKQHQESLKFSSSIVDYKIWCFNGTPYYTMTCSNRDSSGVDLMLYDRDWNSYPEYIIKSAIHRPANLLPKPKNYQRMLNVAAKLSEGFPVVRVDLYNEGGNIYFGEMTFTSLGGMMDYYTDEFQNIAGQLIKL